MLNGTSILKKTKKHEDPFSYDILYFSKPSIKLFQICYLFFIHCLHNILVYFKASNIG